MSLSSSAQPKRKLWLGAVLFALGMFVGAATSRARTTLARVSAEPARCEPAASALGGEREIEARSSHARSRSTAARAALAALPERLEPSDPDAARGFRRAQSKDLVDQVRRNVARAERRSPPGATAELAVNATMPYVLGWVDAVARTSPDLLDELGAEIEHGACDAASSDAQRIVMFRVLHLYPELAGEDAFACVIDQQPKEDLLLWSALDAFRASGLPKSAGFAALERSAQDPRTRDRLLDNAALQARVASEAEQVRAQAATALGPGELK